MSDDDGKVVPIFGADRSEEDESVAHVTGKCRCLGCGHEWMVVAPAGLHVFECSECGTMRGVYQQLISPAEGQQIFRCTSCDNDLFSVQPHQIVCCVCGMSATWKELAELTD